MDHCSEEFVMKARESKGMTYYNRGVMKSCFTMLFWATIVYMLASMASSRVAICELVQAAAYFVMGVASIRIGRYEKKNADLYYVAGAGHIFNGLVTCVAWYIGVAYYLSPTAGVIAIVIFIIGLIASFVGFLCEVIAYSRTMEEIDYTLSYKWKKYMKMYLGLMGGLIAFVALGFLVGWDSVILIIAAIALIVLALVVAVMKPMYLHKTAAAL